MSRFQIQSAHAPEQCLTALDELVAMGPNEIDNWDIACPVGDHSNHVTYRTLEAADVSAARSVVPPTFRDSAQVTEVAKVNAEQVRSFH